MIIFLIEQKMKVCLVLLKFKGLDLMYEFCEMFLFLNIYLIYYLKSSKILVVLWFLDKSIFEKKIII